MNETTLLYEDAKTWRLIETPPLDAFRNMAIDEAIVQAVRQREVPSTLRFYDWLVPSISIGYFQNFEDALDYSYCLRSKIPVVRRITGGRAVLHDNEITYSVGADSHIPGLRGIHETYLNLSRGIVLGLQRLGVPAEIFQPAKISRPTSPYCFSISMRNEVVVSGKKLIGSAQRRWREAFIQHGSIRLSKEPKELSCIRGASSENVTGLEEYLDGKNTPKEIKDAIVKGLETALQIRFICGRLTDNEHSVAEKLTEKYKNPTKQQKASQNE